MSVVAFFCVSRMSKATTYSLYHSLIVFARRANIDKRTPPRASNNLSRARLIHAVRQRRRREERDEKQCDRKE